MNPASRLDELGIQRTGADGCLIVSTARPATSLRADQVLGRIVAASSQENLLGVPYLQLPDITSATNIAH